MAMDSFTRLLENEYFDCWMCVYYLYRHKLSHSMFSSLCDKMRAFDVTEVEYYLPQLTNIFLYHSSSNSPIEIVLLHFCSQSIHFALRLAWLLDSAVQDKLDKTYAKANTMRELVESAAINKEIPSFKRKRSQSMSEEPVKSASNLADEVTSKDLRCKFFNEQLRFIYRLTNISLRLRQFQPQRLRTAQLKTMLIPVNNELNYRSVYFPLVTSTSQFCRILKMSSDDAVVLNSRERAPYLLYCEVEYCNSNCADPELSCLVFSQPPPTERTAVSDDSLPCVVDPSPRGHSSPYFTNNIEESYYEEPEETHRSYDNYQSAEANDKLKEDASVQSEDFDDCERNSETERDKQNSEDSNSERGETPISDLRTTSAPGLSVPKLQLPRTNSGNKSQVMPTPPSTPFHLAIVSNQMGSPNPTLNIRKSEYPAGLDQTHQAFWSEVAPQYRERIEVAFGTLQSSRKSKIEGGSEHSKSMGFRWDVMSYIVKAGDDIRQEQLAMQLIRVFQCIWQRANLPIFVQPYEVLVCGNNCGIIETVLDAASIDSIKKRLPEGLTLLQCFNHLYGGTEQKSFQLARRNFIESMVGYSIITYLLQIKDRHNGNIMLMKSGHVVHIDFGFMLNNSPGSIKFESSPFKLTREYCEIIGSVDCNEFQYFKILMFKGFLEVRKNMEKITSLVEMMLPGDSLPCFAGDGVAALKELAERFPPLHEPELAMWVKERIEKSLDAWSSRYYDKFQNLTNNIK